MLSKFSPLLLLVAIGIILTDLAWNNLFQLRPRTYQLWQWAAPAVGIEANDLVSSRYIQSILTADGAFDPDIGDPIFLNHLVATRPQSYASAAIREDILGVSDPDKKWIEVNLTEQHLYAHEGDEIVFHFPISAGKWAPTVEGEFRIWIKLRYHRMIGGSKELGTFYDLPNVPYVMYFYQGYGLHGAYWHNNFGSPMSHGCVNESIPDARKVFEWTDPVLPANASVVYPSAENPGTRVVVHR